MFYTWLGPSYQTALVLNVLLGALTTLFILLLGDLALPRPVAFVAALAHALSTTHVTYVASVSTETAGLFLLVLSTYLAVLGIARRRNAYLFGSGSAFALADLTRTIALLALPAYAALTLLL